MYWHVGAVWIEPHLAVPTVWHDQIKDMTKILTKLPGLFPLPSARNGLLLKSLRITVRCFSILRWPLYHLPSDLPIYVVL